jgi:outer membrane receptor protein involved in Fe transport
MGDVFYDAAGNVVQDVTAIKSSQDGKITPWLTEETFDANGNAKVRASGFKDYSPQTQIMPRIAFSFPISDEANFFANYDILTQRPRSNVFSNPINYYLYSLSKQSVTLVSPDIAPEKTINYQLGFKQKIGNTSALTLTAFYKELKDNFQQLQIATAYPASYITFKNQDFGTIKGFTLQYDLRRTNNLSANIAYTLQFANGTGSNASSAGNLISSGESEPIRIPLPLDYDQRHTIVASLDYRYGMGTDYNGPAALKGLLEGFGSNFIIRAGSGTPYSRISQDIVQNILSADDTRFRRLIGEINGSRLPWQINMDLRMDKDFQLTAKAADGKGRSSSLNLYVLVQNVLNAKRIASLYPATGLPDDDGYLTSPQAVQPLTEFQDPQAYIDMYHIAVNNPDNFKLPRVIRIGAIYNF